MYRVSKLLNIGAGVMLYNYAASKINNYILATNNLESWRGSLLVAHPRFLCPYVDVIQLTNDTDNVYDFSKYCISNPNVSKYDIYYDKFEIHSLYPSITKKFILPMLNTSPIMIHNIDHNAKTNRMYLSGNFIIVD